MGLQGLDEHYLGVDMQFGGADQRKIFTFAREQMPKIGYKRCTHLMNPMVPGLTGSKMSSSDAKSKLDLLDSKKEVENKVKGAYCREGDIENNGPLSFCEFVLFPIFKELTVQRKPEHGGNHAYKSIEEMSKSFQDLQLHPGDLKKLVSEYVNKLLDPIRKEFQSKELQELTWAAYPETRPQKAVPKQKGPPQAVPVTPGRLDFRVGEITAISPVPNSDKLYIETVDFGVLGKRTVLSGLQNKVPL